MTYEEYKKVKDNILLIDIREADELIMQPALPEAVHMPMMELLKEVKSGKLPKDRLIVTICRSGGRSRMADAMLRSAGYDVDHIEGGMMAVE